MTLAMERSRKVRVESVLDARTTQRLVVAIRKACIQVEKMRMAVDRVTLSRDDAGDLCIMAYPPLGYNVPPGRVIVKQADIPLD